jgi:antirestriction protein ArdC
MTKPTQKRDLYQEVTDKIIAALEAGTAPWQKSWSALAEHGLPRNGMSGRHYQGINTMLLFMEAQQRGFDDSRYMTFKQASEAGYKIRKGAKSIPVYFFKKLEIEERDQQSGDTTKKNVPYLTEYRVFNAQDIEGLEPSVVRPAQWKPVDVMEKLVKKLGVNVQYGGSRAFFDPNGDYVRMPVRGVFPDAEAFYGTLSHEIAHWSGHSSRLNRQFGRFGDEAYAREELRAELASAFLAAETGIAGSTESHAAYVGSWIKALKNDRREIFRAASDASKIVSYMLGRTEEIAVAQPGTDQEAIQPAPTAVAKVVEVKKRRPLREAMRPGAGKNMGNQTGADAGFSASP